MDPTRSQDSGGTGWVVEGYLPRAEVFAVLVERVRQQVRACADESGGVRLLHHATLPDDEMYLLLLEGPSAEAVEQLAVRAGLEPDRITCAVHRPEEGSPVDP